MGTKKKFDYEQIEAAAKATATNEAFCTQVGIALTSFYHFKNSDPEFSAAFNRGRGREEGDPLLARLTAEDFHGFGEQHLRPLQIARAAETNVIGINQHFKRFPDLRAAYEKGKRGIALADELSTASDIRAQNNLQTDDEQNQVSQNSALGLVHEKIKKALESRNQTIHQITSEAGVDPMTVYNALSKMISGGAVEKYYAGDAIAFYRLKRAEAAPPDAPSSPVCAAARKRKPDADFTEIEQQRVFRAVAAGCNLTRSICLETGISVGVVMDILDAAEGEEIVARREPNFIAYFLKEDAPRPADRVILNGKGGVRIERVPESAVVAAALVPSAAIAAAAAVAASSANPVSKTVRWANAPISANGGITGKKVPKGIVYSEEMFEQFGRENLTKKAMGERLGVGNTAIHFQLNTKPRLKEAYEHGLRNPLATIEPAAPAGAAARGVPRAASTPFTEKVFEQFGREKLVVRQIADRLGVAPVTIFRQLRKPQLKQAFERGKAAEILVSPVCGRCGDEMIAQHFEDKVVSWYCSDCWEQWDKNLTEVEEDK